MRTTAKAARIDAVATTAIAAIALTAGLTAAAPQPTTVVTQDGAIEFTLPSGWTFQDRTRDAGFGASSGTHNAGYIFDEAGRFVMELDQTHPAGPYPDAGGTITVVDEHAVADDVSAAAWIASLPEGSTAHVELASTIDGGFAKPVPAESWRATEFQAHLGNIPECETIDVPWSHVAFASDAEAQACLATPTARAAFEVLASVEFHDIPAPTAVVTTPNGTASFTLPAHWVVLDDRGGFVSTPEGRQWQNYWWMVQEGAPGGIRFQDGPSLDGGPGDITVLERRELARGFDLVSGYAAGFAPVIAIVERGSTDPSAVPSGVDGRDFRAEVELRNLPGCAEPQSASEAVACLAQPRADALRDVLATLELHDVPAFAVPAGHSVVHRVQAGGAPAVEGSTFDIAVLCSSPARSWLSAPDATSFEGADAAVCGDGTLGSIHLGTPADRAAVFVEGVVDDVTAERTVAGAGFSQQQLRRLDDQAALNSRVDVTVACGDQSGELRLQNQARTCTPGAEVTWERVQLRWALTKLVAPEGFAGEAVLQPTG